MKTHRLVLLSLFGFLSGCAAIDGGPGKPPEGIPDGISTYQFVYKAPFLLDRNYLDVSTTYTGNWVGSRPRGEGQASNSYGRRCNGVFGIDTDAGAKATNNPLHIWAKGDIYAGNTLIYSGVFENDFMHGESCVPGGQGVWKTAGWTISGEMAGIVSSRHQSNVVLLSNYVKEGPCSMALKDGTRYVGSCKGPAAYPAENGWLSVDRLDDPLILATPAGTMTAANGRRLPDAEMQARIGSIQRALAARKAVQDQEAAEAAAEARRQRQEQAAEDARQSAINRQGLLAIAGSVAIGQGMSGKSYSDSQRAAVVDAWTKDRVNAAQGITSDNLSGAAAAASPRAADSRALSGQTAKADPAQAAKPDRDQCAEHGMRRALAPSYTDPAGYWGHCRDIDPYEAGNGWKYAVHTASTGASAGPLDSRTTACNVAQKILKVWESHVDRGVVITDRSPCVCETGEVEFKTTANPNGWACRIYIKSRK